MSQRLTNPLLVLAMLTAGACFDPMVDPGPGGGDGTSSDGSTTEPVTSSSTTALDTTDTQADSTGASDSPPVITAFTVNNSTMPPEHQVSGVVAFDVDAMDDVGLDRIEIYDGDTLLTTVTEIPYVTEILLTSADNGSHAFSAVAYDTEGQTAQSEVVPLSVNILGGEILEIREDIADFRVTYALNSIPRVVIDSSNEVTIMTTTREDVAEDPRYGLSAFSYTDTLSFLWTDDLMPTDFSPYRGYWHAGRPAYDATSSSWWIGLGMYGEVWSDIAAATIDTNAEDITDLELIGPAAEPLFMTPVAFDSTGSVILSPTPGQLQKRPTLDGEPTWTVEIEDANFFFDIFVAPDDSIIVVFSGAYGCPPDGSHCVYKLSADGDILWTRTGPTTSTAWTLGVAISPEGHVALAGAEDGPARLVVYDEAGATITDRLLTGEPHHDVRDIAYDAQGMLTIAGEQMLDYIDKKAWAGRFDEQGNPLWFHVYEFDSESGITGIATNGEGKLFAVGWEDRFDSDLAGWSGRGWIAELAL